MSKLVIPTEPYPAPVDPEEASSSSSSSDDELCPQSGAVTGESDVRAGDTAFELPARESLRHLTKRQRRRAVERAIARQRLAALEAAPNAVEVPLLQPRYGRERRLHRSMRVTTDGSSVAHANASEMLRGADQPATAERLVVTMGDTSFASNVTFDQPYALYRHGKRRIYAHSLGYGADGDLIVERSEVAALTSDGFTSDTNARSLLRQLRGASTSDSRGARQTSKGRGEAEEAFSTDEVEAAKRVQLRRVQTTVSSAVCVDPRAAVPVDRFQATSTLAAQARGTGLFGAAREAVSDAEACPRTAGMDRNLWRRKYPGVPCPKNRKVRNRLMNDFFVSEHTRPLVEAAREQRTRSSSRKRSSSIPAALYDAPPPDHFDNDVCSSMTGGDFFPRGFPSAFRKLAHRDEDDQRAAIHQMIRDADEASPPSAPRRPGSAKKRSGAVSAPPSGGPSATVTPKLGPVSVGTAYRLATLPVGDGGEALKAVQRMKAQAQLADPSSLSVARFQTLPLRLRSELQHAMDATEFMPQFIRDVETRVRTFVAAHVAATAAGSAQNRKGKNAVLSPASSPTTSTATMTPVAALPPAAAVDGVAPPSVTPTFPRTDSGPMQVETTGLPESAPVSEPVLTSSTIDVHCRDGYGRLIVHGISRFYGLVSKSEDVTEPQLPPSSESHGRPTTRGIHGSSVPANPPPVLWGRITRITMPVSGRVPPIPAVTLVELLTGKLEVQQKTQQQRGPSLQSLEEFVEPVKAEPLKAAKVASPPEEETNAPTAPKRFRKKRTLDSRRRILPLFF